MIFYFHPENWGRWTHFDEHIFQRGWNHQLVLLGGIFLLRWKKGSGWAPKEFVHSPLKNLKKTICLDSRPLLQGNKMNPLFSFVKEERGFSHPHFCRRILEVRKGKTGVFVVYWESFRACWMWFFTGIVIERASLVLCGYDFGLEVIPCGKKPWFSKQSCRIPKQVPDHQLNGEVKKRTHSFFLRILLVQMMIFLLICWGYLWFA